MSVGVDWMLPLLDEDPSQHVFVDLQIAVHLW